MTKILWSTYMQMVLVAGLFLQGIPGFSQVVRPPIPQDIGTVLEEVPNGGLFRNGPSVNCKPAQYVNEEPVLVSALMKNYDEQTGTVIRLTEPLVVPGATKGVTSRVGVPAFSILKPLAPIDFTKPNQVLVQVPVKVISLPNEEALVEMRTNRRLSRAVNGLPLVEEGAEGSMKLGAIRRASDYAFKIKDPAVLKSFPRIETQLAKGSLRYVYHEAFLARECCTGNTCEKQFAFEITSDEKPDQPLERYYDNTPDNALVSELFPIQSDKLPAMGQLLELMEEPQFDFIDFRYFDTRGFVRVPLDGVNKFTSSKGEIIPEMQEGPLKTLHYASDDPNANDAYGAPVAICAFLQAVKKFNTQCTTPECRVQWGDFYHSDKWYTHNEHHEGTCVDVRPVRKVEGYHSLNYVGQIKRCSKKAADGTQTCRTITVLNNEYDRARTQMLVDAFTEAGGVGKATIEGNLPVNKILFNDTKGIKGVTRYPGHSNHLHVCFPEASEKVQSACLNGI